jgi:uncharacterized protein (TIGR02687 family)
MNKTLLDGLKRLFDEHRVVFWNDRQEALFSEFGEVELEGVEKLEVAGNEFGVKVRVLAQEPEKKFLLYRRGERPADEDDWLLDLLAGGAEFRTDQASLLMSEWRLGEEFRGLVERTGRFFARGSMKTAAGKALAGGADTPEAAALKLAAVAVGTENPSGARVEDVMKALLREEGSAGDEDGKRPGQERLEKSGLRGDFWEAAGRAFGYVSKAPGAYDFALSLFRNALLAATGESPTLAPTAASFLRDWSADAREREAFAALARRCEEDLGTAAELERLPLERLLGADCLEAAERRTVELLAEGTQRRTLRTEEVRRTVERRRGKRWFETYREEYRAVEAGAEFLSGLEGADFGAADAAGCARAYAESWWRLDQAYRKFTLHARQAGEWGRERLAGLKALVDGRYANECLPKMNEAFQRGLDAERNAAGRRSWPPAGMPERARDFWKNHIAQGEMSKVRVAVVVSDALRYEVAEEVCRRLGAENRYVTHLDPMTGELPSYTQLGMAALLPHGILSVADAARGTIASDGEPTAGTEARRALLKRSGGDARTAAEVLDMNKEELLAFEHGSRVLFVYHNEIDATGDNAQSENMTFEAAERTVETLVRLVKKMAGPNHVANFFLTSDHGFLYQETAVPDAGMLPMPGGDGEPHRGRRFVMARRLPAEGNGMMKFDGEGLGLQGGVEVLVPKATGRFRMQGGGGRYAHGGASLQETIVPLVTVKRRRGEEIEPVGVRLLEGSGVVTTPQFTVSFFQEEAVGGKRTPRTLRFGLWSADGRTPYSNVEERTFQSAAEDGNDRIFHFALALTPEANALAQGRAVLRVEERIGATALWRPFAEREMEVRRAFGVDF